MVIQPDRKKRGLSLRCLGAPQFALCPSPEFLTLTEDSQDDDFGLMHLVGEPERVHKEFSD
jgi:hypothetical protein